MTHISGKYKFKRHNVFHGCRVDLAIFVNEMFNTDADVSGILLGSHFDDEEDPTYFVTSAAAWESKKFRTTCIGQFPQLTAGMIHMSGELTCLREQYNVFQYMYMASCRYIQRLM